MQNVIHTDEIERKLADNRLIYWIFLARYFFIDSIFCYIFGFFRNIASHPAYRAAILTLFLFGGR